MATENGVPEPQLLHCEVCGRAYKTERGRAAHMAKLHPPAESVRTPWMAPPDQPPPRPVPGATSADLAAQFADRPPPAETFRWSRAPDVPQSPQSPQPALPPPPPSDTAWRPTQFRSLQELSGIIRLLVLLGMLALLVAFAANVYLGVIVPPRAGTIDLFRKIDENQWIAWVVAGAFAAIAHVVIVIWLYRAYKNQLALGVPDTSLPPAAVAFLCFVPIVSLIVMTLALREIWRNADLQRNEWAANARRSKVPGLINSVWVVPLLAAAACLGFVLFLNDRLGPDGVSSVEEARILFFSRAVLLFELFCLTLALRRVFGAVTEQQERAQWHYQMGRNPPPRRPPATSEPAPFPPVPS